MFAYIDGFYNTKRIQKHLAILALCSGYKTGTQNKQNVWLNFLSENMLMPLSEKDDEGDYLSTQTVGYAGTDLKKLWPLLSNIDIFRLHSLQDKR